MYKKSSNFVIGVNTASIIPIMTILITAASAEASRAEDFPAEAAAAVFRVAEDRLAAAVRQEAFE